MHTIIRETEKLLETLGYVEEPLGLFYTDQRPEGGYHPKENTPLSREREEAGQIDFAGMREKWSCILGHIRLARKKHDTAWFAADHYGCMGGSFFSGFTKPALERNAYFVSTGIPGSGQRGERYLPSPESMHVFLAECDAGPAPAKYCVVKPLSLFTDGEEPLVVLFFARPEALFGLTALLWFTTGKTDSIAFPFGAGCTNIISWPLRFIRDGEDKAVLGAADLSCRKFMKPDEMTLAIPLDLYRRMLAAAPESALPDKSWGEVRRKAARSAAVWGEAEE